MSSRHQLSKISDSKLDELKPYLDSIIQKVETPAYIPDDPVLFIHAYDGKQDQLLAGFLAALMAWGRRDIVINKVYNLLERLDHQPHEFIRNYGESQRYRFEGFKHRTFKPVDIHWLITILKRILRKYGDFELFWRLCYHEARKTDTHLMEIFPQRFFEMAPESASRTRKHVSSAARNSACKRLWLFLRWTVRRDSVVDQPLMNFINPSELMIPLDVHVARYSRALGLLQRAGNDWKAVIELTQTLRKLSPHDPAKYDYALFGMGIYPNLVPDKFIINKYTLSD